MNRYEAADIPASELPFPAAFTRPAMNRADRRATKNDACPDCAAGEPSVAGVLSAEYRQAQADWDAGVLGAPDPAVLWKQSIESGYAFSWLLAAARMKAHRLIFFGEKS